MSPRRNRPRRPGQVAPDLGRGIEAVEVWGDERWRVRQIPGSAAVKSYHCPGCQQEIRPGVPHLVVWSLDGFGAFGGESDRRHWHTGCWRARDRRGPR